jgi:hypothetical protein
MKFFYILIFVVKLALCIDDKNTRLGNLDEIKKLLRIDLIKKCANSNPSIVSLCPHYSELHVDDLKNETNSFLHINDIENVLINEKIVKELVEKCDNDWCLDLYDLSNDLLSRYGNSLCLVSTCFDEMKEYISNCARSELTKYLFDLLPLLCKVNLENLSKSYCLEDTLKLIHVEYARNRKLFNGSNAFNVNF